MKVAGWPSFMSEHFRYCNGHLGEMRAKTTIGFSNGSLSLCLKPPAFSLLSRLFLLTDHADSSRSWGDRHSGATRGECPVRVDLRHPPEAITAYHQIVRKRDTHPPHGQGGSRKDTRTPPKVSRRKRGKMRATGRTPRFGPPGNGAYMPGSTVIEMVAAHFFP